MWRSSCRGLLHRIEAVLVANQCSGVLERFLYPRLRFSLLNAEEPQIGTRSNSPEHTSLQSEHRNTKLPAPLYGTPFGHILKFLHMSMTGVTRKRASSTRLMNTHLTP